MSKAWSKMKLREWLTHREEIIKKLTISYATQFLVAGIDAKADVFSIVPEILDKRSAEEISFTP